MRLPGRGFLRRAMLREEVFRVRRSFPGGARASVRFDGADVSISLPDYYSWSWLLKNRYANLNHWHEPSATRLFEMLAQDHRVLFDIGAHLGYFSALFASKEGNQALAVEPLKENFERLQAVEQALPHRRVAVRRYAVSDREGEISFSSDDIPSKACMVHKGTSNRTETVPMTTLPMLIDQTGLVPDLLKIDVEGAEGLVLAGAGDVLNVHLPTIILEVHREVIPKFGSLGYEEILERLRAARYSLYVFEDHRSAYPAPLRPLAEEADLNFDIIAVQRPQKRTISAYNATL